MVARAPLSAAAALLPLLVVLSACVLCCAGGPSPSRIHFGGRWTPSSPLSSPRRQRQRSRSAPRVFCDRACQIERSKARPPCEHRPRDAGLRCGDGLVRYSYVAASNSCVPFLYGGCRGNANNFPTFEMCRDRCKTPAERATQANTKIFGVSETARTGGRRHRGRQGSRRGSNGFGPLPRDSRIHFGVGPRRGGGWRGSGGAGTRFGGKRDTEDGEELSTRFGGGRRSNPKAEVGPRRGIFFPGPVAIRRPSRPRRTKSRSSCLREPRQAGWSCGESTVRYSYIHASNSCVPFEFMGCGGTSNSFATFSECSGLCKSAPLEVGPRQSARRCREQWKAGPCRGFGPMMRYFYNDRKAACELALYSGCGGNTNRFFSRHSCERACLLG